MSVKGSLPVDAISVFGLGKLGALIAGCYASRGFSVIGVDIDRRCVESCERGIPWIQEPGIEELFRTARGNLSATTDGVAAVVDSETSLIVVPTPSEPDGGYSLKYVLEACTVIAEGLQKRHAYHLVALKSTVLPGSCDNHIIPLLESRSGKRCGQDFGFCYNPEFIALGSVISNILHPDLTLIGESDPQAGGRLLDLCARLLNIEAPVARMNVVNAELAKLAVNTFVTMKISFANLLAAMCERLPGGDVDKVTEALGRDSRIGPKYIKGGLGFGGPCFPRDNAAMLSISRRLGISFPLAQATDEANRAIPSRVAELVASQTSTHGRVAVLGLSYKVDTPVIDNSQGMLITEILAAQGFDVSVYDPLAMDNAREVLGKRVRFADNINACTRDADIVLIATPWKQFKNLVSHLNNASNKPLIIDCWGLLDGPDSGAQNIIRLGTSRPQGYP
jgi:UDPglucose 6-dehydrogenase